MTFSEAAKILGLELAASKIEIREAYRRLVVKNHPDKFQDEMDKQIAEKNFKKIQEAYDFLIELKPAINIEDRILRSGYDVETDEVRSKSADPVFKVNPTSDQNYHWSDVASTQQKILLFLVAIVILNVGGLILMIYWSRLIAWIGGFF